ncbi:uncharacterized protein CEXT_24321 [Caerostris extrusa]|uniref:Uncharacterized protein n=1 Tax=Caerostris extrusa TaxID=172846 RepID=A0AAV4PQR9_CAEEX|nr:uncharacterized protein CEXT_24321 [Caerostris extrusa]
MDTSELDIFLQQEDSKNIQLRNLSSINQSVTEYAYFEPKRSYYPRLFKVIVSLHQENKDYVTIDIKKNLNDCDPLNRFAYDIITWTFSIIDIEGVGRYYQSFTKENIVHFPYVIQIPDFVKKTVIFEQADELIPNGILTISCEVSFMSYPGPAIEKNHRLGCWTFEEYRPQVREKRKEEEICLNNDCEKIIYENEKKLVNDMFHFLKTIEKYKEDDLEEKSVEYWKKTLLRDLASDELFRTYLHFNPIFQTYSRLKRKLMILLGVFPEYANLEDLEPEFHIPWTQTRLKFKRRFKIQKEKVDKTKANLKKIKHQSGTLNEEDNIAEIDDEWKVFVSLVEHELENDIEYDITGISRCNNDDKWNFIVETEDGISFTLPFKNNQETLGSKLASSSSIFKNMLRNPMKEKHEKKK